MVKLKQSQKQKLIHSDNQELSVKQAHLGIYLEQTVSKNDETFF